MTIQTDTNDNFRSNLEETRFTLLNEDNTKVEHPKKTKRIARYICVTIVVVIVILVFIGFLTFTDTAKPMRCLFSKAFGLNRVECQTADTLESLHMDFDSQNYIHGNSSYKVSLCNGTNDHTKANCSIETEMVDLTPQQAEYVATADKTWNLAWEILKDKKGWTKVKGDSLETGRVFSKNYKELGTVFRLEAYVDIAPYSLFKWGYSLPPNNPMVEETSVVANITRDVDIVYTLLKPIAGGLISSRDSLVLRHFKPRDNGWMLSSSSVKYPGAPSYPDVIRSTTTVGASLYAPVEGNPNKCLYMWFNCATPGGWVPQWLLNRQVPIAIMDNLKSIKERISKLKENTNYD